MTLHGDWNTSKQTRNLEGDFYLLICHKLPFVIHSFIYLSGKLMNKKRC